MLTTFKVYTCYAVKIYKNNPNFFFSEVACAQCTRPESAFEHLLLYAKYFEYIMKTEMDKKTPSLSIFICKI